MINVPKTSLVFLPVLLYPPLMVSQNITASTRVTLFIMLIMYLLFRTKRFQNKDMLICSLLAIVSMSMLTVDWGNLEALRTVGSVTLTLVFAYALSRAVEMNDRINNSLVQFYTIFFIIVPIFSVMSLVFFKIFGEYNLFNLYYEVSDFKYTPFGILLYRGFYGIDAYRSFFFFIEPVYLGLFYAANVILIAPYTKGKSKIFFYANIVGGVLTFSYLFFVCSVLLVVAKNVTFSRKNALRLLLIVGLVLSAVTFDFFSESSLGDRAYRMNLFLKAMQETNVLQFMFGRGFLAYDDIERGFSAGFLTTIYEVGIVNSIAVMLFTYNLANKNTRIFLLFSVAMLVIEPIKLPLFWVLVAVLSILMPDERIRAKNFLRRGSLLALKDAEI